jgi:hypothetical protein
VTIHESEALLIQLRRGRRTPDGRRELQKRVVVEHTLAQIAAIQGTRTRYRGRRKNELDFNRAAAIANLMLASRDRLDALAGCGEVKMAEGQFSPSPASREGPERAALVGGRVQNRPSRRTAGELTNDEVVFTSACKRAADAGAERPVPVGGFP